MTVFIVGGIGGGVGVVADQLLIQERVPDAARGRVRAANDALVSAAYAISLGFGGFIVAVLGARGTYAFAADRLPDRRHPRDLSRCASTG